MLHPYTGFEVAKVPTMPNSHSATRWVSEFGRGGESGHKMEKY